MSARLHQDDSWPKRSMLLPEPPVIAAALQLVHSEERSNWRTAADMSSSLRFAGWILAVCVLIIGPGALPWAWCRIGGESLVTALFLERLAGAIRGQTLSAFLSWRGTWSQLAIGWLMVACASTAWGYATGWGTQSPYPDVLYNGGWAGPLRQLVDAAIAVMGYYAASAEQQEASAMRRVAPVLVAAAGAVVLCGIEAAHNILFGTSDPRLEGTFTNPNLLGAFLCIALPVCAGIAAEARSGVAARLGSGALAAALAAALWLSGSRGALLGCLVGLGFLAAYRFAVMLQGKITRDPTTRLRLLPAGAMLLLVCCLPVMPHLVRHFVSSGGAHIASDDQRQVAWRGARLIIHQHPITGLGLGSYPAALGALGLRQANPATASGLPTIPAMHLHAHDLLLEFWAERGLAGLLLAASLIACTITAALRCLKRGASMAGGNLNAVACAALLATLTQNIADYTLWYAPLLVLFWQLPALMTSGETADNR